MFDTIQDAWSLFRYGYAESAYIAVAQSRRSIALEFQHNFINEGLDCRVEMTDIFEFDGKSIEIDDGTMVIATEFSGGWFTGPTTTVHVLELKDIDK